MKETSLFCVLRANTDHRKHTSEKQAVSHLFHRLSVCISSDKKLPVIGVTSKYIRGWEGSKQNTESTLAGEELRDLDILPAGLHDYRPCPAVYLPVGSRRL
jgi:hypothetical protein